jgi:hypothetical protein
MPRALRDALARHVRGTTAKTVPGDQPGRTQDTGDRADRTAVRGRAKAQGIEVKHRHGCPLNRWSSSRPRLDSKIQDIQPARLCRLTLMPN